jgi:hypothetical protein
MRNAPLIAVSALLLNVGSSPAENYRPAKVSFDDFKELVAAVEPHRAGRLIRLDQFLKMSKEPNTVIFDSRSDFRYDRIHVKGARHLSFTDFTQDNLRKALPDANARILIYCNNNFEGNETDFATKAVWPSPRGSQDPVAVQMLAQEKPRMMALNVPTYINLFGYGYKNVYELAELVDVKDPRIEFEGSIVKR